MILLRGLLAGLLLAAIFVGSRVALVALLTWLAVDTTLLRRELFLQQEERALTRLGDYWRELTKKKP